MSARAVRGFTLIELTIALLLLALSLLALLGALGTALHQTAEARLRHVALRAAESVADSVAIEGIAAFGSRALPGFGLRWSTDPCAAGECVRVLAHGIGRDGDSLAVVVPLARPGVGAAP